MFRAVSLPVAFEHTPQLKNIITLLHLGPGRSPLVHVEYVVADDGDEVPVLEPGVGTLIQRQALQTLVKPFDELLLNEFHTVGAQSRLFLVHLPMRLFLPHFHAFPPVGRILVKLGRSLDRAVPPFLALRFYYFLGIFRNLRSEHFSPMLLVFRH